MDNIMDDTTLDTKEKVDTLLRKAYNLLDDDYWILHGRLAHSYLSGDDQLDDIRKLTSTGQSLLKIVDARSAL
jgi:hypothetical protein